MATSISWWVPAAASVGFLAGGAVLVAGSGNELATTLTVLVGFFAGIMLVLAIWAHQLQSKPAEAA